MKILNLSLPGSLGLGLGLALAASKVLRRRRRLDYAGKSVVIAGGSRGLGLVLARQLAEQGARLALLARDTRELERAGQELTARDAEVMTLECDTSNREQVEAAIGRVIRRYGRVDMLIYVSGDIQVGALENQGEADFDKAMKVHFWGALFTIQAVAPVMLRQGGGRIVNIASIGGAIAVPHLLPYTASKYALVGLSDGMRAELARYGIRVTTVIPGLMRTGSYVNAFFKGHHRSEYAWFSISSALPFFSTSVEKAAHQILEAGRYGDPILVITWQAKLLIWLNSLFPGLTSALQKLVNLLLPRPDLAAGQQNYTGWESQSTWSPSLLTRLGDREIERTNQAGGEVG